MIEEVAACSPPAACWRGGTSVGLEQTLDWFVGEKLRRVMDADERKRFDRNAEVYRELAKRS